MTDYKLLFTVLRINNTIINKRTFVIIVRFNTISMKSKYSKSNRYVNFIIFNQRTQVRKEQ